MTTITELARGINFIDCFGRGKATALENLISRVARHHTVRADRPGVEIIADLGTVAAEIEKAYILIPRADLPKTDVVKQAGRDMVDVDGADSLWHVAQDPANLRRWGLEYLAAAEAITEYQASAKAAEAEDAKKLDAEADALRFAFEANGAAAFGRAPELWRNIARKARELHKVPQ